MAGVGLEAARLVCLNFRQRGYVVHLKCAQPARYVCGRNMQQPELTMYLFVEKNVSRLALLTGVDNVR